MRYVFALALGFSLVAAVSSTAYSADFCAVVFKSLPENLNSDPVEQMITWEQTSNTARWKKDENLIQAKVVRVPIENVQVRAGKDTPEELLNYFVQDTVLWPKHPYNTNKAVPYFSTLGLQTLPLKFSASRSMFIRDPKLKGLFSVKMPTTRPHGEVEMQYSKSDLTKSVIISRRRSEMISEIDNQIGLDPKFEVLTDKLSISDTKTGNGFVIRDLTPLDNGNYMLPAFSVPYAGREIAKHIGVPFKVLWKTYWAKSLGESKAKLLLRYGLQMKTPNAQNMLIELDKNLIPTGRMFFRDISDSALVGKIAEGLGIDEYLKADKESGYSTYDYLFPNWENSVWQMDEGGVDLVTSIVWGSAHDNGYMQVMHDELSRTDFGKAFYLHFEPKNANDLFNALKSKLGQRALNEYHQLLIREQSANKNSNGEAA